MPIRGVRGATTVPADLPDLILAATREMLQEILIENPDLKAEDLASALFTITDDLRSVYPAKAARDLGWTEVPLLCAQEIPVPGSVPRCIRVLLHWNTHLSQSQINHVYLHDAVQLRPDLVKSSHARGST